VVVEMPWVLALARTASGAEAALGLESASATAASVSAVTPVGAFMDIRVVSRE
jgi:hypothetical protein